VWARDPETGRETTYGDVRLADELQFSVYNFDLANTDFLNKHFEFYELECRRLLDGYELAKKNETDRLERTGLRGFLDNTGRSLPLKRYPILAAYDLCLKCSHLFNILDARGAISVTERVSVIARVRALAVGIAKAWVDQQRAQSPAEEEEEPVAEKKLKKKAEVVPTTA
jgi:glycyl-tRNA synthetase alpha chain